MRRRGSTVISWFRRRADRLRRRRTSRRKHRLCRGPRRRPRPARTDRRRLLDPRVFLTEKDRGRAGTLRATLDAYLAARKDLRPRSREGYRVAIEGYLKDWLDRPIRDVTPEMV